jgi:hypothetical protein
MGRLLTWLGGALGLAALWRFLKREHDAAHQPPAAPLPDPAAELRAKLEAAREAGDDRDEFDAAEGQTLDAVEPATATEPPPRSLEERRRAIHEKAQEALGEMQKPADE